MSDGLDQLKEAYAAALEQYLSVGGEPPLHRAYEVGRQAVRAGLSVLDMASVHQEALVRVLVRTLTPEQSAEVARRAAAFFLECLSPFEMSQRGFQETISTLRQLNAELERQAAELAAVNKELEAFTCSVSHDLRAPLRHIDGFSRLLLDEYSEALPERARRYLSRVRDGTRRMGQMVDDLLNLTHVGRRDLDLRLTGLNSLVEEVLGDLRPETEGREVRWEIAELPFVECDPALMKQVFANLLGNAVKFTRPRPCAVIQVGTVMADDSAVIFVRDNGVGFSMKHAQKLFGVFQRLHRQEDFEGTGVGLATVERVIHKHGGRVWAEAELNKGATFYFTLGVPQSQGRENDATVGGAVWKLAR